MDILTICAGKQITSAASVSRSQSHSVQEWKTFYLFVASRIFKHTVFSYTNQVSSSIFGLSFPLSPTSSCYGAGIITSELTVICELPLSGGHPFLQRPPLPWSPPLPLVIGRHIFKNYTTWFQSFTFTFKSVKCPWPLHIHVSNY